MPLTLGTPPGVEHVNGGCRPAPVVCSSARRLGSPSDELLDRDCGGMMLTRLGQVDVDVMGREPAPHPGQVRTNEFLEQPHRHRESLRVSTGYPPPDGPAFVQRAYVGSEREVRSDV